MTAHRLVLLVAGGCLTVLALMLLVVPSAAMGRVLVDFRGHGLHQGDVPVLGIWAIGVGALAWGWRRGYGAAFPPKSGYRGQQIATPERLIAMSRIDGLDGIRAVAVMAVVVSHLGVSAFSGGGAGVLMFFVLSGFLMTTLLLRERDATGTIRLAAFYGRRAVRLLPALVVVMVATVAFVTIAHRGEPEAEATYHAVLPALLYFSNWLWFAQGTEFEVLGYFGHFWSLSVEEQFYAIWPVLLLLAGRRISERTLAAMLAGVVGLSLAVRLLTIRGPEDAHLLFGTHAVMDQLAFGALLAALLRTQPARVAALSARTWVPALAVLAAIFLLSRAEADGLRGVLSNTIGPTLTGLATMLLLARICTAQRSVLTRLLEWPPVRWIGEVSYAIYLWHILAGAIALQLTQTFLIAVPISLGLTVLAAWASQRVVEAPSRRALKPYFEVPTSRSEQAVQGSRTRHE